MRLIICLFTTMLLSTSLYGQKHSVDSTIISTEKDIMQLIKSVTDNRDMITIKARILLKEYFDANKLSDLQKLLHTINEQIETEQSMVLLPFERLLLNYRIGNYPDALNLISADDTVRFHSYVQLPPRDDLYITLVTYFAEFWDIYIADINRQEYLAEEEKEVLGIAMKYLLADNIPDIKQKTVNRDVTLFLKNYPDSEWENSIKLFREEYELAGFCLGYALAGGMGFTTGKLSDYVSKGGTMNLDIFICYENFFLSFNINSLFKKLERDYEYKHGIWEKGSKAIIGITSGLAGYSVIATRKHRLTPFVALGGASWEAPKKDTDENKLLKKAGFGSTLQYGAGIEYHFMFWERLLNDGSYGAFSIRFRYKYTAPNYKKHTDLTGGIHDISLGVGMFLGGAKKR